jgi:hypothetical protein
MLRAQLTPEQQNAIKQSYLNVISLFMDQETVKGEFLRKTWPCRFRSA